MIKKIGLCLLVMFLFVQSGFCQLYDIGKAIYDFGTNQWNEMNENIFRTSMVSNAIATVSTLQKNYEDTKRFYDEYHKIVDNPEQFADDLKQYGLSRANNPALMWNDRVARSTRESDSVVAWGTRETISGTTTFLNNHLAFGNAMSDWIKELDKKYEKTVDKIKTGAKEKIEEARIELQVQQLESQNQTNHLLLRILDGIDRNLEETVVSRQRIAAQNRMYAESAMRSINRQREELSGDRGRNRQQRIVNELRR